MFQAENGGIVMVSFYSLFLTCGEEADVKHVVGEEDFSLLHRSYIVYYLFYLIFYVLLLFNFHELLRSMQMYLSFIFFNQNTLTTSGTLQELATLALELILMA